VLDALPLLLTSTHPSSSVRSCVVLDALSARACASSAEAPSRMYLQYNFSRVSVGVSIGALQFNSDFKRLLEMHCRGVYPELSTQSSSAASRSAVLTLRLARVLSSSAFAPLAAHPRWGGQSARTRMQRARTYSSDSPAS
jgi:hypothetical protein